LQKSIEEAVATVRTREGKLNRARLKLTEAEHELRLLIELAELRSVELPAAALELRSQQVAPQAGTGLGSRSPRSRAALLDAVVEILAKEGQPMQIQGLMSAVRERQLAIPGQGSQANLIAVISRDPRIVRPQRGYYGLAEWGLKDTQPAKGRRAKRRGRSGARK
jgi:hypothetical protein